MLFCFPCWLARSGRQNRNAGIILCLRPPVIVTRDDSGSFVVVRPFGGWCGFTRREIGGLYGNLLQHFGGQVVPGYLCGGHGAWRGDRITDTADRESGLQWRPDGERIGYLSAASGTIQLWEINRDGTGKKQVSRSDADIHGFCYSPDQTKILLIKSVKLDQDIHDLFPDLPKADARLENDLMYRHWDSWHDYTYNHIFVAGYEDGTITAEKDIMEGERYDSPTKPWGGIEEIAWSPDGKKVAYTCKKLTGKAYSLSTNTDIYIYDTETGETVNLTEGMPGYDKNPRFSPDGRMIAWESMARDGYEADKIRLFVADLLTGEKKDYSASFDQNSEQLCWSSDSRSLFFISSREATSQVFRLNIPDGEIMCLTDGIHNYGSPAIAGDKLVVTKTSMSQPAELYLVDPVSGSCSALTEVNKGLLDQLTMGKVEKRWIKTTDGKEMLTWVIYPPEFDPSKKYPALLYCQGGPQSTVDQFWSYRWNFQMMAANGYIIVAPNRRGFRDSGRPGMSRSAEITEDKTSGTSFLPLMKFPKSLLLTARGWER